MPLPAERMELVRNNVHGETGCDTADSRADKIIAKFDSYLANWCGALLQAERPYAARRRPFVHLDLHESRSVGEVNTRVIPFCCSSLFHVLLFHFHIFRRQIELKTVAFIWCRRLCFGRMMKRTRQSTHSVRCVS